MNVNRFFFYIITIFVLASSSESFAIRKIKKKRLKPVQDVSAFEKDALVNSRDLPISNPSYVQNNTEKEVKEPRLPSRKRRFRRSQAKNNKINADSIINKSEPTVVVKNEVIDQALMPPQTLFEKPGLIRKNDNIDLKQPLNSVESVDSEEIINKDSLQIQEPETDFEEELSDVKSQDEEQNEDLIVDNLEDETIEFYFENTDLQNVVNQIGELYGLTFVTDDVITPLAAGNRSLKGNKLSFKTHKALTKKEGWDLYLTFLNIAGFSVIPQSDPKVFRITTVQRAQRGAIPSFIGVDSDSLPNNDQMIRYVYFIENINPETLKRIVDQLLSSSAGPSFALRELKALILTDKSHNIKTLMTIVKELDKVSMPQSMSVLKLTQADAEEVANLYTVLTKTQDSNVMSRIFPARRQPTSLYFPENVRVIPEKRSNSLILLGDRDAIEKIESFVIKFIDIEPTKPYSPLHRYQLKFADATNVANIMNELTKFGSETSAGKVGGVRAGDKYFKPMLFIPEPSTNQLVIRGEYDDYLKAVEVIRQLDEQQPQIAIEILICSIELSKDKEVGGQIRSGDGASCGANVNFQTGNLGQGLAINSDGDTTYPGCQRLLGNLLNVAKKLVSGNTVVSFGCDAFGVWGILRALEQVTDSEVISNPFLLTTNKTTAEVSVGEIRRLQTGTVVGTVPEETFADEPAELKVNITPQINSDGMIVLDIVIDVKQFTNSASSADTQRTHRRIDTKTTVADNEVIALGGLIRNRVEDSTAKTPLLGDVPLLGWLFKNRQKIEEKANLLILVSTKIIKPGSEEGLAQFTNKHIDDYYGALGQMYDMGQEKDPLTRLFFKESKKDVARRVEDHLFKGTKQRKKMKSRFRKSKRKKDMSQQPSQVTKTVEVVAKSSKLYDKRSINRKQILAKSEGRKKTSLADLSIEGREKIS